MAGAEAIGLILVAWALGAALCLGLGLLVLAHVPAGAGGLFRAAWTGLAVMLGVLQAWHLAWPVGGAALVLLAALAAAGLVRGRHRWAGLPGPPRERLWACVLAVPLLLLVADRSLGPPLANDSGGYHLGSVRWAAEHPAVPGLGHLDLRLALASSHFLYAALLDAGPFTWRSHHLASGLLLALLLAQLLAHAARPGPPRAVDLAAALLVAPTLSQALGRGASSPTPDLAVFVLGAVLGLRVLEHCEEGGGPVLDLVVLAAALVTVKLSAAGLAAGAVAVALVVPRPAGRRALLAAAAVAVAFLVPWMAANVVLTGYPAYPLAVLPAPVGWRLPQEELAILQGWIRSWARAPGLRPEQVLGGHGWVGPWAGTLLGNRIWVQVPLALLAAGAAALLVSRRSRLLPALAAPLAGIGYWLLTAPDVRFLGATLWLLAGCAVAIAAVSARGPAAPRVVRAVAALLALGVLAGAWRRGDLLLRPDPVAGFHPTPAAPVRARELRSGLAVQVPQGGRDCFYAPLPCAADVHPGLRLRGQGLRSGFVREP